MAPVRLARPAPPAQYSLRWLDRVYPPAPFPVLTRRYAFTHTRAIARDGDARVFVFLFLVRRLQFFKADGSGFFAQHPQTAAAWYEVDTRTGAVFGYSLEAMSGAQYVLKVSGDARKRPKSSLCSHQTIRSA